MMTTRSASPIGQRLQQHGMNDAEDGGIRSDSESNGEDGDGGKTRILGEGAEGVAHRDRVYRTRASGRIRAVRQSTINDAIKFGAAERPGGAFISSGGLMKTILALLIGFTLAASAQPRHGRR